MSQEMRINKFSESIKRQGDVLEQKSKVEKINMDQFRRFIKSISISRRKQKIGEWVEFIKQRKISLMIF